MELGPQNRKESRDWCGVRNKEKRARWLGPCLAATCVTVTGRDDNSVGETRGLACARERENRKEIMGGDEWEFSAYQADFDCAWKVMPPRPVLMSQIR